MKLFSLNIEGYRRFRSKQRANVDCRLVAIVGPNEAGKSSFLRLIHNISNDKPFSTSGPSQDITRDLTIDADQVVVQFRFLLEKSDLAKIKAAGIRTSPRWFLVSKSVSGKRTFTFSDPARREIPNSVNLAAELIHLKEVAESNPDTHSSEIIETINQALAFCHIENTHDDEQQIKSILVQIRSAFKVHQIPAPQLSNSIREMNEKEHPNEIGIRILSERLPTILQFTDEQRNLGSYYDIRTFFDSKNRVPIPQALKNLLATAEVSIAELHDAHISNDQGKIESLLSKANRRLKSLMNKSWKQSNAYINLRLNSNLLHILIDDGSDQFEAISERSDGLRQFAALFAFMMQRKNPKDVILLIDEAETHLHYDAQADLIQMLAKQEFARKVIYTTHSIGCLPEDLGMGLRMVKPSSTGSTSEFSNSFWKDDVPGFSPVLYAMGATTMAFLPVRYCLLVEGPSEIIALPKILRDAAGVETLGFQIVPGLASAGESDIKLLNQHGTRVAYLVDGDQGGDGILKKLRRSGVDESKIIRLRFAERDIITLEDLYDLELFIGAFNEELRKSGIRMAIAANDFENFRSKMLAVGDFCRRNQISCPSKVNIAYSILEMGEGRMIHDSNRSIQILEILKEIKSAL